MKRTMQHWNKENRIQAQVTVTSVDIRMIVSVRYDYSVSTEYW